MLSCTWQGIFTFNFACSLKDAFCLHLWTELVSVSVRSNKSKQLTKREREFLFILESLLSLTSHFTYLAFLFPQSVALRFIYFLCDLTLLDHRKMFVGIIKDNIQFSSAQFNIYIGPNHNNNHLKLLCVVRLTPYNNRNGIASTIHKKV